MWNDVENSIRTILSTIDLLDPISVRVILNRGAGQSEEDLRLYSIGMGGSAFESTDSRFYGIMQTQKTLTIPSIQSSSLLSGLPIGEGSAVFYPIHSRYAYCGFIWACFSPEKFTEKAAEIFSGCCEWAELKVREWQDEMLDDPNRAQQMLDLLERMKIPALLLLSPSQQLYSNPSFERMNEKEAFLTALQEASASTDEGSDHFADFELLIKKVDFSETVHGCIYMFPGAAGDFRGIRFGENEIQYYRLLTQKATGTLALLESAGELTPLQQNYISKTEHPLTRLEDLFSYGEKHYQRTENSAMSLEVLSVTEIAQNVILDMASQARKKRVEIELNTDPGSSAGNAVGDPWLLTLAIYDLLDNAIRFSSIDGKPISVQIAFGENEWTLSVEDFGAGISPLDLERMRELNYAEAAGSGLHGIALVKYVAKAHNGKLQIESRLGKGSRFTLTIPKDGGLSGR